MRGVWKISGLLFLFLSLLPAQDQPASGATPAQATTKHRPTIGVALEGGGALGLAHIGVLQWFEDHHIPIDYLAGTSMGGLVGGLYASGKSPQELHDLVKAQNWDVILGGSIPYEDLSFRRKEDKVAFPNSILLGLRKGLLLPGGLNAGQQISMLIDRETLRYSAVKSFDDLPIPFRCVATDLVTGKQAVFKDGSLSTAMRATMAIPGLFSPVRDSEHVYVDGGLVGNMPTDVVRAMGADIVIGVHLETSPAEADKIQSLVLDPWPINRRGGCRKRNTGLGQCRHGDQSRPSGVQFTRIQQSGCHRSERNRRCQTEITATRELRPR